MQELEIYIITILAIAFTVAYSLGSRYNYKIQKKIWKEISGEIKPYSGKVSFKGFGSSGFKIACSPSMGKLKKLEILIILLSREILLYYLFSKCRRKHDTIVVKSNFYVVPNFSLEIVKKGTKIHKELIKKPNLTELRHEKLSEQFFLTSSNPDAASKFLSNKDIIQRIIKLNTLMNRLSITSEEPQLLISCSIRENVISQVLNLAFACGRVMEQIRNDM